MRRNLCRCGVVSIVMACLLTAPSLVWACSVPVFRYALERWPADRYPLYVFHEGELAEADQELLDRFEQSAAGVNGELQLVDVGESLEPQVQAIWEGEKKEGAELPWVAAHTSSYAEVQKVVFSGKLREQVLQRMVDSPLRREIAQRILDGESAVWVLLESGDASEDDEKAALVNSQLRELEETLELPEGAASASASEPFGGEDEEFVSDAEGELKIAFSMVRLSRDDPAERAFVNMLLASEPGLEELEHTMVFPVYGRGRALYALAGAGINEALIKEACEFLIGPCSCQIKDENPGADLLMTAHWDDSLEFAAVEDKELPPLVGLGGFSDEMAEQASQEVAAEEPAEQTQTAQVAKAESGDAAGSGSTPASGSEPVSADGEQTEAESSSGSEIAVADAVIGDRSEEAEAESRGGWGALGRNLLAVIALAVVGLAAGTVLMTLRKKA